MRKTRMLTAAVALITVAQLGVAGCATWNKASGTAKGGVIGAGAGGVVGAAIGKATGSVARGAIIGAAVGGAAGAIIGHQMDQQAKEIAQTVPGAKITRVGEGMVVTFDSGLLFDFDSADLRAAAKNNLYNLAESLKKYPGEDVLIVGHTDSIGSQTYNLQLSNERARSAAAFLVSQGVTNTRIMTQGMGEQDPVASNATSAGRQANRRVEVALYASKEHRAEVERTAGGS